ncbi:YybH family protein [Nonomuraea ferruginea]
MVDAGPAEPLRRLGGSCTTGSAELNRVYHWVGSRFSRCGDLSFDVEVADIVGDLAYTVGCERFTASVDGRPAEPMTIRVTHVYRREDGIWKIVHRHGDWAPVGEGPPPAMTPPSLDDFRTLARERLLSRRLRLHRRRRLRRDHQPGQPPRPGRDPAAAPVPA